MRSELFRGCWKKRWIKAELAIMGTSAGPTQRQKIRGDWVDVPPVFIVGCARSGTTLLRLMLSAHSRISISSEGAYIYRLRSRLASNGDMSDPRHLKRLHRDLVPLLEAERFLSIPSFDQLLDWVEQFGADVRSLITFYGTWQARIQGKERLAWWGDNAPYHVYHVPFFNHLFPTSKVIFMVRDPRDTYASSKAALGYDLHRAVGEWEKALLDGALAESYLGPTRVRHLKYEDLGTTPRPRLQALCGFLGVEYEEAMLNYHHSDAAKAVARLNHNKNLLSPVFATSVRRYRQALTRAEITAIHRRLYSPMTYFGYLSYEEYDHHSRRQLTKVATRRSESLKNLSVNRVNRRQPGPRTGVASPHWMEISPVFIIGHGRSGTTLLRMMLSAHPKIFISSEGAYICPLRSQISTYGDLRDPRNLTKLHNDLYPWLEAVNFLNPPRVQDVIAWVDRFGCDERSLITFYGTWEARTLGRDDLTWWGDNEPSHVCNIPYLKELFPNSRFILMIRDPRDVYASFKTAWPDKHTAESLAMAWERCLLDGALAVSRLGSGVVQQVRYENLVMDAETQLKEICRFLKVEYTDAVLNFYELEPAKHLSRVEHHRNVAQPLFRSSVGRYRHVLSQQEITAIHHRLYSPMTCLGYLCYEEYDEITRDKGISECTRPPQPTSNLHRWDPQIDRYTVGC
jgi:Sulfotransferase family